MSRTISHRFSGQHIHRSIWWKCDKQVYVAAICREPKFTFLKFQIHWTLKLFSELNDVHAILSMPRGLDVRPQFSLPYLGDTLINYYTRTEVKLAVRFSHLFRSINPWSRENRPFKTTSSDAETEHRFMRSVEFQIRSRGFVNCGNLQLPNPRQPGKSIYYPQRKDISDIPACQQDAHSCNVFSDWFRLV
jgi:hypothetical protein